MRKKKPEEKIDTTRWMTTFANLMVLLLAFFIVMVALGVRDQGKKRLAINSLFGSFGFKRGGQSALGIDSGSDITIGDAPIRKEDVEFEKLRNISRSNGLESDVKIQKELERIIIAIKSKVLFEFGTSNIHAKSFKFLKDLSGVLKNGRGRIELRGYTDRTETILDPDSDRKSMHLSVKRALVVMHFFVDKVKIPAKRIVAHGFGSRFFKKTHMEGNKEWAGGVKIIIDYRNELPYGLRKVKKRGGLLDYKGFFFKH